MHLDKNKYLTSFLKEISQKLNPLDELQKGVKGFCKSLEIECCGFFTAHPVNDTLNYLAGNFESTLRQAIVSDIRMAKHILNNQSETVIPFFDGIVINGSKLKLFLKGSSLNDTELNTLWLFVESLNYKEKVFIRQDKAPTQKAVDYGFIQFDEAYRVTYICRFCQKHFPEVDLNSSILEHFDQANNFASRTKTKAFLEIMPYLENGKYFLFVVDMSPVNLRLMDQADKLHYFSDFFDHLHDGLFVTGRISTIIRVNEFARQMIELPSTDSIDNYNLSDFIHPEDKEIALEHYHKLVKEGRLSNFVCRMVTLTGKVKHVQISSTAVYDDKGAFIGSRDVIRDVTKLKEYSDQLEQSEQLNRKIFETSQDAIITTDEKGYILQFNQMNTSIFGRTKEYIQRGQIQDLINFSLIEGANSNNLLFLLDETLQIKHKRFEAKGFHPIKELDIEVSVALMRVKEKTIFSFFIRNISDSKAVHRALLKAIQKADNARVKEQHFLATMSHEIRTPMNAVVGMTHLLNETELTEVQRDYLNALLFSTDSLMDVLNNILDLSKIESGEMVFEKEPFDMEEVVRSLMQSTHFQAKGKPVSVDFYVDGRINQLLLGDKAKLTQVLSNLLSNSIKFTKKGFINCEVKVKKETPHKFLLQIEINDSGIGIPEEKVKDVFDNFKQADQTIRRKYGGTGLGLAIVKQLIEKQAGSISLRSEIGVGTTFTILLPFEKSMQAITDASPVEEDDKSFDERIKEFNILVVEDNMMNQKLISKIFSNWGASFKIAGSGFQALEYTRSMKFDLILMDIHMPDMDGYQTLQLIQEDRNNKNGNTRVIALTASALQKEKTRALSMGMVDFITKPFTPNILKRVLMKWDKVEQFDEESKDLDLSFVEKLGKRDSQFVREMIEIFLSEVPKGLVEIHEALKREDGVTVSKTSHRIKSNFLIMGMHSLVEKASILENQGLKESPDWSLIQQTVHDMDKESNSIRPTLEEKMKSYGVKVQS